MKFVKLIMAGSALACAALASAAPLAINGSFDAEKPEWKLWVPASSSDIGATFERVTGPVHSGTYAAKLSSQKSGRYGIGNGQIRVKASPGQRYRVSFWVKGDGSTKVSNGHVGPLVRILLRDPNSKDVPAGHFFIGADGRVDLAKNPSRRSQPVVIPQEWTKMEAVIEMPEGVTSFHPEVFAWGMSGTVYVDDLEIEPVPAQTPLSPLASVTGGLPTASAQRVTQIAAMLTEEPVFFCPPFPTANTGTACVNCRQQKS